MKRKGLIFFLVLIAISIFPLYLFAGGGSETNPDAKQLVYWSMWNETEPQAKVLTAAIEDYMKLNPDVNVTIQWNGRDIRKTLQPALDAGTTIDIWDEDLERIVLNWQSYSLNMDNYYEKSYSSTNGKTFADISMKVLQNFLRDISTDGSIYAVPYQPFVISAFYNKDQFDKAGITSTPSTWDELLTVCKKLKQAGFTPITIDDDYMDLPLGLHLSRKLGGSDAVEALIKDTTGKLWDDPKVLEAAKEIEELASKGYISSNVMSNKWPAGQVEIATDQVSIYIANGTWLPNEVMSTTGEEFRWGQFKYPAVPGGDQNPTSEIYGAQGFQINKNCAYPDEAFDLLVYITTGKWDKEMSEKTYGAPMDTATPWPVQIADVKGIFDGAKTHLPWGAGLGANPDALPIVLKQYSFLLGGKITAEEFISNVKAKLVK